MFIRNLNVSYQCFNSCTWKHIFHMSLHGLFLISALGEQWQWYRDTLQHPCIVIIERKFTGIWAWTHSPPSPSPMYSPSVGPSCRTDGVTSRYIWKIIIFTADYLLYEYLLLNAAVTAHLETTQNVGLGNISSIYSQLSWELTISSLFRPRSRVT